MGIIRIGAGDDGRMIVQFPYSTERVGAIKKIPGRLWHPDKKVWSVPIAIKFEFAKEKGTKIVTWC